MVILYLSWPDMAIPDHCHLLPPAGRRVVQPCFFCVHRKDCDAWEKKQGIFIDRDYRCVEWSLAGKVAIRSPFHTVHPVPPNPTPHRHIEPFLSSPRQCDNPTEHIVANCNTSCTIHQRCKTSTYSGWSLGVCDKVRTQGIAVAQFM